MRTIFRGYNEGGFTHMYPVRRLRMRGAPLLLSLCICLHGVDRDNLISHNITSQKTCIYKTRQDFTWFNTPHHILLETRFWVSPTSFQVTVANLERFPESVAELSIVPFRPHVWTLVNDITLFSYILNYWHYSRGVQTFQTEDVLRQRNKVR